ncbi:ATP-binding cassette domain-containing protein [Marinomonas dokdonensis]|uniref:ATP-binding cassette domain-containing protein n=1 Tax=Marinomonas dokdonensis TaxID=328224 RepID=UPI00405562BB
MLRIIDTKIEPDDNVEFGLPDLILPFGQVHVLRGISDAVKSSFLNLICGLLAPKQGSVFWSDMPLFEFSESFRAKWRAEQMGVLAKQTMLIEHLSALDNVVLSCQVTNWREGEDIRQRATNLLIQLGIEDIHKNINQFNQGQKQSIALVRALVADPNIIIADDPTGRVDELSAQNILSLLREQAEQGKFVLIISGDPRVVQHSPINSPHSHALNACFGASIY